MPVVPPNASGWNGNPAVHVSLRAPQAAHPAPGRQEAPSNMRGVPQARSSSRQLSHKFYPDFYRSQEWNFSGLFARGDLQRKLLLQAVPAPVLQKSLHVVPSLGICRVNAPLWHGDILVNQPVNSQHSSFIPAKIMIERHNLRNAVCKKKPLDLILVPCTNPALWWSSLIVKKKEKAHFL